MPAVSDVAMPATMKPTGEMAVSASTFFRFGSTSAGTTDTNTVATANRYMTVRAVSLRANIWWQMVNRK